MEIYTTIMKIISLFGILTLILSIYIFIVVPTKMSFMFRATLIGNFLVSCSLQIFLTLGVIPSVLLPCCAFQTKGLINYIGVSTFIQMFLVFGYFGVAGWFMVLICLMRAVAVSVYLTERRKMHIIFIYLFISVVNPTVVATLALKLKISDNDRLSCSKMFINKKPPPELFMPETLVFSVKDDSDVINFLCYCIFTIIFYSTIGFISTGYLLWSLRMHRTQSSSSKALESQQKLTVDVLKLVFFQMTGITVPPTVILFYILMEISSGFASEILVILWVININIVCILMIRLIPAYKERLSKICLSILPVELMKRITKPKPQMVSVQSSVVRSTSCS